MHLLASLLSLLSIHSLVHAQNSSNTNGVGSSPADRHYVTAAQAQKIISASAANASAIPIPQNIAVVDPSGLLVAFLRQDNAFPGSMDISMKKARTAVLFNGLSSGGLYEQAQPGQPLYGIEETNGGLVVFGGGFPIYLDGFLIGGVGVSGGSVSQDEQVATAGVLSLGAATSLT
ncbi:DUF336-domain-containing protein [Polyplosphaeria fusca]|uniref:DUF336-domain-containing protein n=1 Tax=Polyplosphaeria fusca TaxID=682080 RepID=A0A9P4V6L0_9PLEO|nr:DUF336-domain-containing protein [Polyplosphaeria fusca]